MKRDVPAATRASICWGRSAILPLSLSRYERCHTHRDVIVATSLSRQHKRTKTGRHTHNPYGLVSTSSVLKPK